MAALASVGALLVAVGCVPGPARSNYPQWSWDVPVGTSTLSVGLQCFSEPMSLRVEAPASYDLYETSTARLLVNGSPDFEPFGGSNPTAPVGNPAVVVEQTGVLDRCYEIAVSVTRAPSNPDNHIRLAFSTIEGHRPVLGPLFEETLCASGFERLQVAVRAGSGLTIDPQTDVEVWSGSTLVSATWDKLVMPPPTFFEGSRRVISPGVLPKGCYTLRWKQTVEPANSVSVDWYWSAPGWSPPVI